MARGRPAKGPGLVEELEGSKEAKTRMMVILETIAGQKCVHEACDQLGIRKTAFHEIRSQVLQVGLKDLEAKPRGRPRQEVSEDQQEIEQLKQHVKELKAALQIANVREELSLVLPHVLKATDEKKKRMEERKKRRRRGKSRKKKARCR